MAAIGPARRGFGGAAVILQACRSCHAPVYWTVLNGRPHPVDAEQIPGGNMELEELPEAYVVAHLVRPDPLTWRYRSHFASCPDAWKWKRR